MALAMTVAGIVLTVVVVVGLIGFLMEKSEGENGSK